jgi:TPR repeat protein
MHIISYACILIFMPFVALGETLEQLEAKVRGGDPDAQYQLALFLENGESQKKDTRRTLFLLHKAAQKGHSESGKKLLSLIEGIKVKAAKQDSYSEYLLGYILLYGRGLNKSVKSGFEYILKSADKQNSDAQCLVGEILFGIVDLGSSNKEIPKNEKLGFEYLLKSAENGNSDAQYFVGQILLGTEHLGELGSSIEDIPKNAEAGIEWLQRSANSGDSSAMRALFREYMDGKNVKKNHPEAFMLAKAAAQKGDAEAAMTLGVMYHFGMGVNRDLKEALRYWHRSAELGYYTAKVFLGAQYNPENWEGGSPSSYGWSSDYLRGVGTVVFVDIGEKNSSEAVKWLKEAVKTQDDHGSSYAACENALGNAYFKGEGVDQDFEEAIKWWQRASVIRPKWIVGNTDALYNLGMAYKNGHGVKRNMDTATGYFELSARWQGKAASELLQIYVEKIGVNQDLLKKAKAVEIRDFTIWEFFQKKDSRFTEAIKEGYTLQEVFEYLSSISNSPAKHALLIANSKYSQFGGLANTDSDAQKLAKVLNSLGFQVSILKNASKEEMFDALKDFEAKVRGTNAIAFFHYGGHGVQVEGKNYLIPADAEIPDERRVSTRAVDLDEVIAVLDSAKPKASVLVVDACRHNPLPATATRSATRGLAVVGRKPKNSVIIYAAEAGNEAFDGLFTPILAENLQEHSDKSLNQIMQKVRAEVFERSKGAQTPGEYNQLFEELYFSKTQENTTR